MSDEAIRLSDLEHSLNCTREAVSTIIKANHQMMDIIVKQTLKILRLEQQVQIHEDRFIDIRKTMEEINTTDIPEDVQELLRIWG